MAAKKLSVAAKLNNTCYINALAATIIFSHACKAKQRILSLAPFGNVLYSILRFSYSTRMYVSLVPLLNGNVLLLKSKPHQAR